MVTGTPIPVPDEAYKANDPGIVDAEKEFFITDMKGATKAQLDAVEVKADQGISDAAAAQADATQGIDDAATAQAKADSSVQLTGDQEVSGLKSITEYWNFPNHSEAGTPTYSQIPVMTDVINNANTSGGSWTTLTLVNGWSGTAKARVDRWGYLEVFASISGFTASDANFATLGASLSPSFSSWHIAYGGSEIFNISSSGNLYINNYVDDGRTYSVYARTIKSAP